MCNIHYEDNQGLCHTCGKPLNLDYWLSYGGTEKQWEKMIVDYDNRTDFRAFDVLICAIDKATKAETKAALDTAREQAKDMTLSPIKRQIWSDMARLLNRQYRAF